MRPLIVKAYGWLCPALPQHEEAMSTVLRQWYISEALERDGNMLRISHEGEFFPAQELVDALAPLLTQDSEGKLDYLDLENWIITRYQFAKTNISKRQSSLDKALESCGY